MLDTETFGASYGLIKKTMQGAGAIKGDKGDKGDKGEDGEDGFSPSITTEITEQGNTKLTIQNKDSSSTVTIKNGDKGDKGETGAKGETGDKGFSPSATVTQTSDGAIIEIEDENGRTSATVKNVTGELVPSVSKYQSGQKTSDTTSWGTGETGTFIIDLSENMPDTDYIVVPTLNVVGVSAIVHSKTVNNFKVTVRNDREETIAQAITLNWQAFKLMTDANLLADEEQIARNKEGIADLRSDKQDKNLETPLTIGGASRTTVEGALGALSTNKANKTEIPASLSDLTDDSTHRLVTDTEKTTWNSKQDSIFLSNLNLPNASYNNMNSVASEIWNYVKGLNKTGAVNFYVVIGSNSWCGFIGNASTSNIQGTITTLNSGTNSWTIFANDSAGNATKLSKTTDLNYTTIGTGTDVTLPNDTGTLLATMTVPSAGKYLIIGSCSFYANSTGIRRLVFSSKSGSITDDRYNAVSQNATTGQSTIMQITTMITFTSSGQKWYLNGFQNSGSTLNCFPAIRYIRLSD